MAKNRVIDDSDRLRLRLRRVRRTFGHSLAVLASIVTGIVALSLAFAQSDAIGHTAPHRTCRAGPLLHRRGRQSVISEKTNSGGLSRQYTHRIVSRGCTRRFRRRAVGDRSCPLSTRRLPRRRLRRRPAAAMMMPTLPSTTTSRACTARKTRTGGGIPRLHLQRRRLVEGRPQEEEEEDPGGKRLPAAGAPNLSTLP